MMTNEELIEAAYLMIDVAEGRVKKVKGINRKTGVSFTKRNTKSLVWNWKEFYYKAMPDNYRPYDAKELDSMLGELFVDKAGKETVQLIGYQAWLNKDKVEVSVFLKLDDVISPTVENVDTFLSGYKDSMGNPAGVPIE